MKKFSLCMTAIICSWTFLLLACSAQIAPINTDAEGLAIKGYDPIAYFTLGSPLKGQKEFQFKWKNATWLFSSQEHLEMFRKVPEKYAPQYGGY